MNDLDLGLRHDDDEPRSRAARRRSRRRGRHRWGFLIFGIAVALTVFGIGIAYGAQALHNAVTVADYPGQGSGSTRVSIHSGDSARTIGRTLAGADVVKSAEAFSDAAEGDTRAGSIQPGTYQLRQRMSGAAALTLLLAPSSRIDGSVTVPEGLTVAQTLQRIADQSSISLASLKAAAAKPGALGLPSYADGHLEGYLFPSTYDIDAGESATQVLSAMVERFTETAGDVNLESRAADYKQSPAQMVITASLIERESKVTSDNAKISRVIRNRLIAQQPLQVDASVLYGVGKAGQGTAPTAADLRSGSPYNVYLLKGLPPTAIASPGKAALEAALAPAEGNWLYYVRSDKAGHHYFTASYPDFLAHKNAAKKAGVF